MSWVLITLWAHLGPTDSPCSLINSSRDVEIPQG